MQKIWKRPELVVLVRGNPEESVLDICKQGGAGGPNGPGTAFGHCVALFSGDHCGQCSEYGVS